MSAVKERLIGAITVMSEERAKALWDAIVLGSVPAEEPDEIDMKMIAEIEDDPECLVVADGKEVEDLWK